ncbi:hypothetical protein [Streptomyces atratus]|uniref:hypothetical protein n=1 Tax=Streptomyces atratus TaxID=1893 RepID=UPI0021A45EA4|nr:hypothetical protein [Streptomyces atratus]MCT2548691.1 hypothetical protein [Streptomyces atratus]
MTGSALCHRKFVDQGWAAVIAGGVGLIAAVGGAVVGGLAAVRGARIGAETNAAAVLAQSRLQMEGARDQWVRQERQRAYLQVMDCYSLFNRECVQYRDQLKDGRPLGEDVLESYTSTFIALTGACAHLALLGPDSVHAAGGAVRAKAGNFVGTIRFWNEDLTEALDGDPQHDHDALTNDWWDILAEEGASMKQAYQAFLVTGQGELLRAP